MAEYKGTVHARRNYASCGYMEFFLDLGNDSAQVSSNDGFCTRMEGLNYKRAVEELAHRVGGAPVWEEIAAAASRGEKIKRELGGLVVETNRPAEQDYSTA